MFVKSELVQTESLPFLVQICYALSADLDLHPAPTIKKTSDNDQKGILRTMLEEVKLLTKIDFTFFCSVLP